MTIKKYFNIEKKLTLAVFLTFFIFPFIHFQSISGLDGLSVPSNSFVLIPLYLFITFYVLTHRAELRVTDTTSKLIVLCLLMLAFICSKQGLSLNSSFTRLSYIIILATVIQTMFWIKPEKEKIVRVIIISLTAQCIYGIAQVSNFEFLDGLIDYHSRPVGSFLQVNIMASSVAIGLILALYQYIDDANDKTTKAILTIYILISPVIIILCSSRTAYISVSIGFFLFFASNAREVIRNHTSLIYIMFLATFTSILYMLLFGSNHRDPNTLSDPGIRLDMYIQSLLMFFDRPIFGWGYGEFIHTFYYSIYDNSYIYSFIKPIESLSTHPHNELALWGIEGGIIGLIFIIAILHIFIKPLAYVSQGKINPGFVCLTPLGFHIMLEHPLYTSTLLGLYFCLIFFIYAERIKYLDNNLNSKIIFSVFSAKSLIMIPVLLIIFQSSILSSTYLRTGDSSIREMIISDFPSRLYLSQMDLLIRSDNARRSKDLVYLDKINIEIFRKILELPAKSLAVDYLINCEILSNCPDDNINFIKKYFP